MPTFLRRVGLWAAGLCLLFASASSAAEPTVIVLSWDGVRYDYLDRQDDRQDLPALSRMQREGARAERLVPPFPSSTFPSHVTLATGTYADRHGIVANRFFDPARSSGEDPAEFDYSNDASWIDAEPLWAAAERQGVRSAVFFWVGSETDWRGRGATYRMTPFKSRVSERTKVAQLLEWLDLPDAERPRLLMSYWHGADHAGHSNGPDSSAVEKALRKQDGELQRLLHGLDQRGAWQTTTLLIVSDHGMVAVSEAIDARSVVREAGVAARVVHASGVARVYLRDPEDRAAARRAALALSALEGIDAWTLDELPSHLRYAHPTRVGQVVAVATPPRVFRAGGLKARASRALRGSTGAHGYDPSVVPEMSGILLALGRRVGKGVQLPTARAIDLAPTVARLLGIDPPQHSEGRALDLAP